MKTITIKSFGQKYELRGRVGQYDDGSKAIQMIEKDGGVYGVLTVRMHQKPPENTIWVKTWSENEQLYQQLIEQGFLKFTGQVIQAGFTEAHACEITDKFKEFLEVRHG